MLVRKVLRMCWHPREKGIPVNSTRWTKIGNENDLLSMWFEAVSISYPILFYLPPDTHAARKDSLTIGK